MITDREFIECDPLPVPVDPVLDLTRLETRCVGHLPVQEGRVWRCRRCGVWLKREAV